MFLTGYKVRDITTGNITKINDCVHSKGAQILVLYGK